MQLKKYILTSYLSASLFSELGGKIKLNLRYLCIDLLS